MVGESYGNRYASMKDEIIEEYNRHNYIIESKALLENEKIRFKNIQNGVAEPIQYAKALDFLSKCLEKYHNEKVIVLIDEYDVPLENAYFSGFYLYHYVLKRRTIRGKVYLLV